MSIQEKTAMARAKERATSRKTTDGGVLNTVMDHAREMFRKYDKDLGGTISPAEFGSLCYDMGYAFPDEQDKKLVLQLLDADGDGEVSFREFFRWWKSYKDKFFVPVPRLLAKPAPPPAAL